MFLKALLFTIMLQTPLTSKPIFHFYKNANIQNWVVVDDVVMGGISTGSFSLNPDGHGVFKGYVSLENNGGFSSVRYNFKKITVENYTKVYIRLKGDGKDYQFRIKTKTTDYEAYIQPFSTTGKWQEITIDLKDLYPTFRGRILDKPNFASESFEEIRFLIANKKAETFCLLIDTIELR
ncbi:CIA30 family protein [Wenyingzhuangia sp. IMCC45574]